jgi:hypothetical protein
MLNKQLGLFVISLLCTFFVRAQDSAEPELASRYRPGTMWYFTGFKPAKTEKARKYDRVIIDAFYGTWTGKQTAFQHGWTSIGFATNVMFDIPLVKGNTFSLGTGVSYSLTRMQHDHVLSSDTSNSYTLYDGNASSVVFDRQTLISHNIALPVELRIRSKGWKHVKLHIGGKIGYNLALLNKSIDHQPNSRYVLKDYRFADKQPLSYSAHVRLGMRNWALFGAYQFSTIFTDQRSPEFHIVQLGLSLSLF